MANSIGKSPSYRSENQLSPGSGAKKDENIKKFLKTMFFRHSSSGKTADEVKDSLSKKTSEFTKASRQASNTVNNKGASTVHIAKDNRPPKKSDGAPATKPHDAPPQYSEKIQPNQPDSQPLSKTTKNTSANLTKEERNQNLMNSLIESMNKVVPLENLNMDWRTDPKDREINAHMFEKVARWKIEIPILINKIASSAILDKSERPKAGTESLSSLKDQLVTTFKKASSYCHNDDASTVQFNRNLEDLGKILRDINPDQNARSNNVDKNPKAPKYIAQPPLR